MKYHFRLSHAGNGRFLLQCVEMFFCSKGIDDIAKARLEAYDMLHIYLSKPSTELLFASPCNAPLIDVQRQFGYGALEVFAVTVEPATAFAITLRRVRTNRCLSQTEIARKLGIKSHSAYQRLEDPLRSNPTIATILRLRKVLPKLDIASIFEPPH